MVPNVTPMAALALLKSVKNGLKQTITSGPAIGGYYGYFTLP